MSSCRGRYDQSSRCCSAASSAETSPSTSPSSPLDPARAGLLIHFGADFVRHRLRYLLVMVEMHRVLGPALAHRPQGIDVAKHVGERHHGIDDSRIAARIHAGDLPAATVEVADHVSHVHLWRHHFDSHNRLEKFRGSLHYAFLEGGAGGDLEGEHT